LINDHRHNWIRINDILKKYVIPRHSPIKVLPATYTFTLFRHYLLDLNKTNSGYTHIFGHTTQKGMPSGEIDYDHSD